MRALILEDNRDRRVAMIGRLAERFPFLRVSFFDASMEMIGFMKSDPMQDVALISLDHDLELIPDLHGEWMDPGTGLEVARWLSERPKAICPIIVHTTNSQAGDQMMRMLEDSHWISHRVVPHDDLRWIDSDWFKVVRNVIVGYMPQRPVMPVLQIENKVRLIRSLVAGQFESGQAFCRAAIVKLTDVYIRELRQLVNDVSVEIISFVGEDALASVLRVEGPVVRWLRAEGFGLGNLHDFVERGPLTLDQMKLITGGASERLARSGIQQIQVNVLEVDGMQALIVVSAAGSLAAMAVQAIITELKDVIEIAMFVGLRWSPSSDKSELTHNEPKNRLF